MPKLYCYIVSGYGSSEEKLMRLAGHEVVSKIENSNCLVFCGGADIDPKHYGQRNVRSSISKWHDQIDDEALNYWKEHKEQFAFLIGICRGGQLLSSVNGGNMWQHIDNHAGRDHKIQDLKTGKEYYVNSVHHQQMRAGPNCEIVAIASPQLTTIKLDDTGTYLGNEGLNYVDSFDTEVLWYPDTKSLCFQAHPEYFPSNDTTSYFIELLNRYNV